MNREFAIKVVGAALFSVAWAFPISPSFSQTAANEAQAYIESAQDYIEGGDLRAAVIQLRNAQQITPDDGEIRFQLAQLYLLLGQLNNADAEIIAASQRGISEERLAPYRAEAMFRRGQFVELLRDVPAANRAPAFESIVRSYRGLAELAQGNNLQAGAMFDDAEQLVPNAVVPKMGTAQLLFSEGNFDGADEKVDEVLALNPNHSQALDLKGGIALTRGNGEEALRYYNAAVEQDPQNFLALLHRAALHIDLRDFDAATSDIVAAKEILPNNVAANYLDALVIGAQNDFRGADQILNNVRAVMEELPDAYFLAAYTKYRLGQIEQAQAFVERYMAQRPEDPRGPQLLATIHLNRGNAVAAISVLEQALNVTPGDVRTIGLLGQAYAMGGEPARALALLQEQAEQQPQNTALRTQLALSQFGTGQFGAAIDELRDVFDGGAGDVRAGPPFILAAMRAGRHAEASEAAVALLALDPDNVFYQELRASTLVGSGDLSAAEELLRMMISGHPDLIAPRRNLARVYLQLDRTNDAIAVFEDRLAEVPTDSEAMRALGEIYSQQGDLDSAAEIFTRAKEAAPNDPNPGLQLIAVYAQQQRWPEAINEGRSLQTRFPNNPTTYDLLGRVYSNSGDLTNGVATYREGVTAFPGNALLHANLATALEATDDDEAALSVLEDAVSLSPNDDGLKRRLIELSYRTEGADAALDRALAIAQRYPANPIGRILAADVLLSNGQAMRAITLLEDAQEEQPSASIVVRLAGLYQATGDANRGIDLLESWTQGNPNDVAPHRALAQLYTQVGNNDAAVERYERIAVVLPNDPLSLNNLAYIYGERQDPRAEAIARRAFELAPQSANIADTLGWILTQTGDAAEGVELLETASTAMPNNLEVRYHYAVALNESGRTAEAEEILQELLNSTDTFEGRQEATELLSSLQSQPN